MNLYTIANTNTKGQLVIPQKMRNELGIDPDKYLKISLVDTGIFIQPITSIKTNLGDKAHYLNTLKKTQGSWKKDEPSSQKRELELKASQKRKQTW